MQCQFSRMALQFTLFHRNEQILHPPALVVVIPIQTTGFYNEGETLRNGEINKVVIPIQTTGFYNFLQSRAAQSSTVVIPIQTTGFYNMTRQGMACGILKVVILIQTTGFYNWSRWRLRTLSQSCHTHPNDRLLQPGLPLLGRRRPNVVIPIQTTGFYNVKRQILVEKEAVVIPIQTTGFYNYTIEGNMVGTYTVVIPIQTTGFYNWLKWKLRTSCCHTYPNDRLLQRSCL